MQLKKKREVKHSERPHWIDRPDMDAEMKRQLALKDRPKGEKKK